jgi:predicted permease
VGDSILQDIRYSFRTLRRAPLFVVTVAVTMGLGLGLLGSAFTILDAYLLKPVDLPNPRALYSVSWDTDGRERQRFGLSDVEALQRDARHFSRLAAMLEVTVMEETVATQGFLVTGNYFDLLGARPALGRFLRLDDAASRGSKAVVVLSHDLWRSRYGSNPAIVGQQIQLGRQRFEVVGVTASDARMSIAHEGAAFWAPLTMAGAFPVVDPWSQPDKRSLVVVGRLRQGATADSARVWLDVWLRQRFLPPADTVPPVARLDSLATPLPFNGPMVGLVTLIMSAFGLVLLVACANVTNLMLARAMARQPEVAVRLALGASRWRVARQLIVESLVLALPATAVGLALIVLAARVFPAAILATFPANLLPIETLLIPLDPDVRVMTFLAAVSLLSAVIITLAPTGRLARLRLSQTSRGEVSPDARGARLRAGLVAMQIGACAAFLVGAVTLLGESSRLANQERNISLDRVAWVRIDPMARAKVVTRLASDPAIEQVALSSKPPTLNAALPTAKVTAPGTSLTQMTGYTVVSPGYFPLFDIDVVRGRAFTSDEAAAGAAVVLVSRATAAALWPGLDPVGQTIDFAEAAGQRSERQPPHRRVRVVGVAEDVANGGITDGLDPSCVYFVTDVHSTAADLSLLVTSRADNVEAVRAALANAVNAVAPETSFQAVSMEALVGAAAWILRAFSTTAWILGLVGLLFAYSGTHAVVSFMVAQRTREFGVRMALGASAWQIVQGLLTQLSRTASIGLGAGLLVAAGVMRLFSRANALLPDSGWMALLVGAVIVLVATGVASLAPLRDAARIDPARALRAE